jgi:hypothetical protein
MLGGGTSVRGGLLGNLEQFSEGCPALREVGLYVQRTPLRRAQNTTGTCLTRTCRREGSSSYFKPDPDCSFEMIPIVVILVIIYIMIRRKRSRLRFRRIDKYDVTTPGRRSKV